MGSNPNWEMGGDVSGDAQRRIRARRRGSTNANSVGGAVRIVESVKAGGANLMINYRERMWASG